MRRLRRPILFRVCRSEKDDFDSGSDDKIRVILMVHEAHGRFCRNFDQHLEVRGWSNEEVSDGIV